MKSAGEAGALMAAALLLAGCAQKKRLTLYVEEDGGTVPFTMRFARSSELPPPKGKDPAEAKELVLPRARAAASSRTNARTTLPGREAHEAPLARADMDPLHADPSYMAGPGDAGPPPDEAQIQGRPEVRRPDSLTPLATDRPGRYASPAPFEKLLEKSRVGERTPAGVAPANKGVAVDGAAAVGFFPPQATAALNDEVPESGVADPREIGSYHIQVATNAVFGPILFDKMYPFMADVDVAADLRIRKVKPGGYWLRYALVDLLGFEHPYTKPLRVQLR